MSTDIRDIMISYDLPLNRSKESVYDFLFAHYKKYVDALHESILDLKHKDFPEKFYRFLRDSALSAIETECDMILEVLSLDKTFRPDAMRTSFGELMKFMNNSQLPMLREVAIDGRLLRIRAGTEPFVRSELFHIPFQKRGRISSQRYSIQGHPCLYLSGSFRPLLFGGSESNLLLCWIECGMPMTFYASVFETQKPLKILHFAKSATQYLSEYKKAKDETERQDRRTSIMQYLMSYPLRAACSIQVMSKTTSFVEEYIIPQLLLAWVRENDNYNGISYQTAAAISPHIEYHSFNLVLPAKNIDLSDGFCTELKELFKLTDPQKFNMCERILYFEPQIDKVRNYVLSLGEKLKKSEANSLHPYRHILSLCSLFLSACSMLADESNTSADIPYQIFHGVSCSAFIVYKSIKNTSSAEDWVAQYKSIKANVLSPDDISEVLDPFCDVCGVFHDLLNRPFPPLEGAGVFSLVGGI